MLVAELNKARAEASTSKKGPTYSCPKCKSVVILKQGRVVVWHFAHKPPTDCTLATGETKAHLEAKTFMAKVLRDRGVRAEVEHVVETLSGDRRADVMAFAPRGGPTVAFELQHCSISLPELETRAFSYAKAGFAQIWIPFIPVKVWDEGERTKDGAWHVKRYSPRPFEKWVHGFNGKRGMWMYDPPKKQL